MTAKHPARLRRGAVPAMVLAALLLSGCGGHEAEDGADPSTAGATEASAGAAADGAGPTTDGAPAASTGAEATEGDWDDDAATDGPRPSVIDVVLSFAAWDAGAAELQAGGYVSPIVEDGGTCTLELSPADGGGAEVVTTTAGFADATTTVCGGLAVAGGELAAGSWTAVLRYESATGSGESAPLTVEVPA